MFKVTFIVKDGQILANPNQANSSFPKCLEKYDGKGCEFIEIESDNEQYKCKDACKFLDGDVLLKTEEDFRQERIAIAPQVKAQLLQACTKYQNSDAKPRIDGNFFSLVTASQTVKKISPSFECPNCDANIAWVNTLWADYDSRKSQVALGEIVSFDFSNNGNPPRTWDECNSELI